MKVKIRLLSNLKRFDPGRRNIFHLKLKGGTTVGQLLGELKIPPSVERVILVNSYHRDEDTVLVENDEVTVFPPMGGG